MKLPRRETIKAQYLSKTFVVSSDGEPREPGNRVCKQIFNSSNVFTALILLGLFGIEPAIVAQFASRPKLRSRALTGLSACLARMRSRVRASAEVLLENFRSAAYNLIALPDQRCESKIEFQPLCLVAIPQQHTCPNCYPKVATFQICLHFRTFVHKATKTTGVVLSNCRQPLGL